MMTTPGPWALSRSGTRVRTVVQQRASFDLVIAELREPDHGSVEANARLIAAAPEMFSWIQKMQQFQYLNDAEKVALFAAARALLDKIEGKE